MLMNAVVCLHGTSRLSPYTFVCSMEEGEGGGRQHMWIYSMDFQG